MCCFFLFFFSFFLSNAILILLHLLSSIFHHFSSALELMKNWTRIGCLLTSTNSSLNALNVNQTELLESIPRLPLASAFIEERGIAESGKDKIFKMFSLLIITLNTE